jgi:beta-glucanase (GH16 family)
MKLNIRPGLWPAWWMLGANFPTVGWPACGEVDVLENEGGSIVETSVHTPDDAGTGVITQRAVVDVDSEWHTWRMQWNPTTGDFTFTKDGVKYLTVQPTQMANWCFSSGVPMFMILNLATGGKAGTPSESAPFPVDLLIDYVRVW